MSAMPGFVKEVRTLEWPTHMLCGVAAGYFVTQDWRGAVAGGLAAMVPDIDEPRSKIGKPLLFISYPLNKAFGHRTLTHSLLFAAVIGGLFMPLTGLPMALAIVAGLLAHMAGDMATGRVHVLYPAKKAVGIHVSRMTYLALDRVTRFGLSAGMIWFAAKTIW